MFFVTVTSPKEHRIMYILPEPNVFLTKSLGIRLMCVRHPNPVSFNMKCVQASKMPTFHKYSCF